MMRCRRFLSAAWGRLSALSRWAAPAGLLLSATPATPAAPEASPRPSAVAENPTEPPVQREAEAATVSARADSTGLVLTHRDDFSGGLERWRVEQTPGGTVTVEDGRLVINDANGCTVWFRPRLQAPVRIRYTATASSRARVSDLNCFWMATDPLEPADLFYPGHRRDGTFASYDALRTYYVGYGGNANTTTRFRRYDGTGARPLEPEHDLQAAPFLLQPDHGYRIELVVDGDRVQYLRDGEAVFDFRDPEVLTSGWFGFRTVRSRLEIDDFEVWSAPLR